MSSVNPSNWLEQVADRARRAEVFAAVHAEQAGLTCAARHVESEATYRVTVDDRIWIGLYTPDRWLSESIEADLMHLGDRIEDLLEEELVEQGYEGDPLTVEHFRDDDRQFVFRSALPVQPGDPRRADLTLKALLAYEACFRELGDMQATDEAA